MVVWCIVFFNPPSEYLFDLHFKLDYYSHLVQQLKEITHELYSFPLAADQIAYINTWTEQWVLGMGNLKWKLLHTICKFLSATFFCGIG